MSQEINIFEAEKLADRSTLRFPFDAPVVKDAAEVKLLYHQERLSWWEDESVTAQTELEASVTWNEQEQTGGAIRVAVYDQTKQSRLNLCKAKITSHEGDVKRYAAWVRGLTALGTQAIDLSIDDITFFGLADD